jgi:hypothetical protein
MFEITRRIVRLERRARFRGRMIVSFLVVAALPLSAGTLLVSNFGPGNTYDTSTGDAWATGGSGESGNAVGFTDPSAFLSYALTQIQVGDNFYTASTDGGVYNDLNIGFWQSTSDLNSAAELESWVVSPASPRRRQRRSSPSPRF